MSFLRGINYWPAEKAMYWWNAYSVQEVIRDLELMAATGFKLVRIFLTWEDFQPYPDEVAPAALSNLIITANLAETYRLKLMPTFFCGHMSGVNWLPGWMLGPGNTRQRFPVVSQGRYRSASPLNCFTREEVLQAQLLQIETVCTALRGHPALLAFDLGNEPSNWCVPPDRKAAREWLARTTECIRRFSPGARITLGMHAEDLEEDRNLWPQDAASYVDLVSMHGYPFYLNWVDNPADVYLVPFLAMVTAWLAGQEVLFQEMGAPGSISTPTSSGGKTVLWSEEEVANYYKQVLTLLHQEECSGALAWCFSDYHPSLWEKPPLEQNLHERFFGLFRADGSAKPAALVWSALTEQEPAAAPSPRGWLNSFQREDFYHSPRANLEKMYRLYKATVGIQSPEDKGDMK